MDTRTFEIDASTVRTEERTVGASLSSETPVRRIDGEEVLSHKPGAVDLSRAPLPLLKAHDNRSLPVGVVENLELAEGRLRGVIRLSSNQDGLWRDICDGIVRNLSIGYQVLKKRKTKNGYTATRWMPYEASLVAAPADATVGINRNHDERKITKMDKNDILKAKKTAADELAELATSGEDSERLEELKNEIRSLDSRLEAFEMAAARKEPATFTPDVKKTGRSMIEVGGGPATDRSYAGMFHEGRSLEVNEDMIREFRDAMVAGTATAGGFSVPEPLAAKWLDDSIESEIIRPRATVWPMDSATRKVAGWDAADQTGGVLFGGFSMEFLAEGGTGTKQKGKLRAIELKAKKGAIFVDISSELHEDGQGVDSQLDRAMKVSIAYGLDNAFINGVGGAEPKGIRNDVAKITIEKSDGQADATLLWENLTAMFAAMYPAGRRRGIWIANDSIIPELLSLAIPIGDVGEHVPVMQGTGAFTILTRPVLFTSQLPELGEEDDLMFVDVSQYAIGMRRDLRIEKSNIPGWDADLMSYRAIVRFDGQGTWNEAITPKNGISQSWAVGLGARKS
ncbi:MAG: hypothetical protein AVO39_08780 [delta proteobacterium MLS_D]|nr:MAG: hypothetical protein AVO39_08780 [delta proteobacterium MLS_D]